MNYVLIAILIIFTSTFANSAGTKHSDESKKISIKFTVHVTIKKFDRVYVPSEDSPLGFAQIENNLTTVTTIKAEEPLSRFNSTKERIDTGVIEIDRKGHSWLAVENANNQIIVHNDMFLDDEIAGVIVHVPLIYAAESNITDGNWDGVANGQVLGLQYSAAGEAVGRANMKKLILAITEQMKGELDKELNKYGARLKDLNLTALNLKGVTTLKVTPDRIELYGAPLAFMLVGHAAI